ncbi:MAG: DUF3141 domain-containing protein [Burkholderiaceae bacterium]
MKDLMQTDLIQIGGAGPAGLAAAITLAKAGRSVLVPEMHSEAGHRFGGDFQGLENWTTLQDALDNLQEIGITTDFAEILKWMHPMRIGNMMFSEKRNPWMLSVKMLTPFVANVRLPVDQNQFVAMEDEASASVSHSLYAYRKARDTASEQLFAMLYGQ